MKIRRKGEGNVQRPGPVTVPDGSQETVTEHTAVQPFASVVLTVKQLVLSWVGAV